MPCARAPAEGALAAILTNPAGAVQRRAQGLQPAHRDLGIREPGPPSAPAHAQACGSFGEGGLCARGQLLSPSETGESAPAGREGTGGGGPVTAPPPRSAPRPRAARPEVACLPQRSRRVSQAR